MVCGHPDFDALFGNTSLPATAVPRHTPLTIAIGKYRNSEAHAIRTTSSLGIPSSPTFGYRSSTHANMIPLLCHHATHAAAAPSVILTNTTAILKVTVIVLNPIIIVHMATIPNGCQSVARDCRRTNQGCQWRRKATMQGGCWRERSRAQSSSRAMILSPSARCNHRAPAKEPKAC
jgi:hypothetical protein